MEPRPTAANPHTTKPPDQLLVEADPAGDSPLRRYIASLDRTEEGERLLRHIRLYVYRADLSGEQSVTEIALEIFQEMVLEALRSEARYDPERSALSWLMGIATNVVKRRREKLFGRRKAETTAADLARADELNEETIFDRLAAAQGADPAALVLASMNMDALLASLAPADRRLIELNVVEGIEAAEVGDALGITAVNVRVRRHRILTKLRHFLLAQDSLEQEAGREEMQKDE